MTDSISTFLKGVHPKYESFSLNAFKSCIQGFTHWTETTSNVENCYEEYRQRLKQHVMRQHIEPVIDAIKFLPCQDLAHIAEMLVNVSSFHASMMPGQNFIGGNIDVATLAKGYGFQWIKKPDGHAVNINNVRRLDL